MSQGTLMLDPKKIEEMARQIGAAIPPKFREVADDVEAKVKAVLQAKLSQLDFVSREEFDVQRQVLLRTREKLEALEVQVQQLLAAKSADEQN
jgi:BMFP domain-containing protein YqiC